MRLFDCGLKSSEGGADSSSIEAELKLLGVKNVGVHNLSPGIVSWICCLQQAAYSKLLTAGCLQQAAWRKNLAAHKQPHHAAVAGKSHEFDPLRTHPGDD